MTGRFKRPTKPLATRKLLSTNNDFLKSRGAPGSIMLKKRQVLSEKINSSEHSAQEYVRNINRLKAIFGSHERRMILMRIIKKSIPSKAINIRATEADLEKIVQGIAK